MGKLSWQGIYAFAATYVAYFSLYLIRKPVGASIPYIKQEFSICSKLVLSIIPNCHLLPYSFTGILLPNLVDRFGGKKSLTFTFGGAGLSVAAIYLTKFFATQGSSTDNTTGLIVFCICIFCGGFFQAFGWPSAVKSLAEHIPAEPRKALIPVWTTCCFIGSTVGGLLLGSILMKQKNGFHDDGFCENSWNGTKCTDEQFNVTVNNDNIFSCNISNILEFSSANKTDAKYMDWRLTFLIPSILPIFMAIFIFFTMPDPSLTVESETTEVTVSTDITMISSDIEQQDLMNGNKPTRNSKSPEHSVPVTPNLSMIQIVREVPAVPWLALAYACAKGSRYWYFYWCIDWLIEESDGAFSPDVATYLSAALDIGSIIGLVIIGPLTTENFFTKKVLGRPIPPLYCAAISTAGAIPVIYLARLTVQTKDVYLVFAVLILLGFLVAISDPIYSGTVASEACDIDGRNLHGSVSGFINGVGSFGALILNPLASYLGDMDYKYALMTVGVALAVGTVLTFVAHNSLEKAKASRLGAGNR